jgi:uncharacterized protein (DUF427 family)
MLLSRIGKIVGNCSKASVMNLPGPGHPITIARNANRVRVVFVGQMIADTARAHLARGGLSACAIHSAR